MTVQPRISMIGPGRDDRSSSRACRPPRLPRLAEAGTPRCLPRRLALGLLFLAAVAAPPAARAILERSGEHVHDAGQFRLFMTNLGVIGNPTYPSFSDQPSLEWPAGSGAEYLLEAGLWVGARNRLGDRTGVSTAAPVNEFRPSLDPVDRIYPSFDGDQGTRRVGVTVRLEDADDDGDGRFDEEFLNGKDDDGDGLIDEDFVALGSQSFACEYRDDTPEARSQLLAHAPQHLRVQQLSFTWSEGIAPLDRCAVVRYRITNDGTEPLYDVYLGFYVDADLGPKRREGYWRDDRYTIETLAGTIPAHGAPIVAGCESVPFELPAVIMEDAPDGAAGAGGGDVPGLLAAVLLDHTTNRWGYRAPEAVGPSAIVHLRGRATLDRTREEISDQEKYALMASGEFMGNTQVGDHRFVLVAGPYSLVPVGAALELTVALMLAADREELQATASRLVERFYGRWLDLDVNAFTGRRGRETPLTTDDAGFCNFTPFVVDHDCDEPQTATRKHGGCRNTIIETLCPHQGGCTPRWRIWRTGVRHFVDFDCNRCTPAINGAESLVRWADGEASATAVSARPIGKRFTPGDRQVLVEWDNAAELPDAARTLPRVSGYRVWRAEGWTRPPGASGPLAGQWRLVAELPLPESGLPQSPELEIRQTEVVDTVPGPHDSLYAHHAAGRYRYTDRGLQDGFVVFYDVTPFVAEFEPGGAVTLTGLEPRARAGEEIVPVEEAARSASAAAAAASIRVVPNPYDARAAWDLEPGRTDPSGRKIAFTGLPPEPGRVEIFSLGGDRVRTLEHPGEAGTVYWDLLSRNGQPVVAGVYLYVFSSASVVRRGKLVIIR